MIFTENECEIVEDNYSIKVVIFGKETPNSHQLFIENRIIKVDPLLGSFHLRRGNYNFNDGYRAHMLKQIELDISGPTPFDI